MGCFSWFFRKRRANQWEESGLKGDLLMIKAKLELRRCAEMEEDLAVENQERAKQSLIEGYPYEAAVYNSAEAKSKMRAEFYRLKAAQVDTLRSGMKSEQIIMRVGHVLSRVADEIESHDD